MGAKEAKEYLRQYIGAKREADSISRRLLELRAKYELPSAIQYSDMPTAHNTEHDLSDMMVKLDELTGGLISARTRAIGIEIDIMQRLTAVEDADERTLLRYRYIDGYEWRQIARLMNVSERSVYRIHGTALLHFPTEKDWQSVAGEQVV